MEDIQLFPCYSPKLMQFLTEKKKIKYKLVGLNNKSMKTMWIFIETPELNNAIKEWKANNLFK